MSPGWRSYYWGLLVARALLTYLIFIDVAYNAKLLNLSDAFKQQPDNQASSRRSTRSLYNSKQSGGSNEKYLNDKPGGGEHQQQQQQQQQLQQQQCCACDEAKYELVFEGLWSRYTHPEDFPENYWLASFSDIIGASHSNEFRMWDQDTLATEGVRNLAESGSTKRLEAELKQVSSKTRTIIKARELRYPLLNGKTSAVFRTDRQHHLVSILSKLNPSPDWILGVSGLELCLPDCSWASQRVVNLYLWDAGTDSGTTFTAPDLPTRPQERIHPYRKEAATTRGFSTNSTTLDQSKQQQDDASTEQFRRSDEFSSGELPEQASPSYQADSSLVNGGAVQSSLSSGSNPSRPYARLTITRQRIYEKSCSSNNNNNNNSNNNNEPAVQKNGYSVAPSSIYTNVNPIEWAETTMSSQVDCRYTDWSDWSTCSSNCGKGIRTRTRAFLDEQANQAGCSQLNLIEKEICLSECMGNVTCVTRDWSDWSRCSVSCGQGIRKRTRSPIGQLKKACGRAIELSQTEVCVASHNVDCPAPPSDSNGCDVSEWSQWSRCSVACGKGTRIRTRQYLRRDGPEMFCNNTLIQKTSCTGRLESCNSESAIKINAQNPISRFTCLKAVDAGPCRASIQRWHFNASLNLCSRFSFGGCLGNANNFETFQDCERTCLLPPNKDSGHQSKLIQQNHHHDHQQQQPQHNQQKPHNPNLPVIDCKLSAWSPWSTCSALCGEGKRTRSRYIVQMPQNGGKPCDKRLARTQKCKDLPPCPPNYPLLLSATAATNKSRY